MNIIKHLFNKQSSNYFYYDLKHNYNIYSVFYTITEDVLEVKLTYVSFSESSYKHITFYFDSNNPLFEIFDNIKLKQLINYNFMSKIKEKNLDLIFSTHQEKIESYNFCKLFLKQFDLQFFQQINHSTLNNEQKINIILFLTNEEYFCTDKLNLFLEPLSWIQKNKFNVNDFDNKENSKIIQVFLKHNMVNDIIHLINSSTDENKNILFKNYLNNLSENTLYDLIKCIPNSNFNLIEDKEIKDTIIIKNIEKFYLGSEVKHIFSPTLSEFIINKSDKNDLDSVVEAISKVQDKSFFYIYFLSVLYFLDNLKKFNFPLKEDSENLNFTIYNRLYEKIKNNTNILNNIDNIIFNISKVVYSIYVNDWINFDNVPSLFKQNFEETIFKQQMSDF